MTPSSPGATLEIITIRGDRELSHEQRKEEHLDICLTRDVDSTLPTGLESYRLRHQALPEMALEDVDTTTTFLGHRLDAPFLLSAMTGGSERSAAINRHLAGAAQQMGLAMGLGSQRVAVEEDALMASFRVRDVAPDILLLANLGAVQLNYGFGLDECRRAVELVGADALVLHLNPLQEAVQPGGDTDFRGLADRIADVVQALDAPIIVKEVGWGLSAQAAALLVQAGVSALDVGGAGGTSWSRVERWRAADDADVLVAQAFDGWGIPTADSILAVRSVIPDLPLIASGGLRTGVDVAVSLALGADLAGMAMPLLQPAIESAKAVVDQLTVIQRQLRIAMFCSGVSDLSRLDTRCLITCPSGG